MSHHKKIIAGNWKMNGSHSFIQDYITNLKTSGDNAQVILFPPSLYIKDMAGHGFDVGGQNCHMKEGGAHTGELSPEMLKDTGCAYVLCGHSERRANCHEDDETVMMKARAAKRAGLTPVICVGENLSTREAGEHIGVVLSQSEHSIPSEFNPDDFILAYEPVWAIGTGKTASTDDIVEMHGALSEWLENNFRGSVPILYGGSVKPDNASKNLSLENVGGVLVGGGSLKPSDFNEIIRAGNSC